LAYNINSGKFALTCIVLEEMRRTWF